MQLENIICRNKSSNREVECKAPDLTGTGNPSKLYSGMKFTTENHYIKTLEGSE